MSELETAQERFNDSSLLCVFEVLLPPQQNPRPDAEVGSQKSTKQDSRDLKSREGADNAQ